MNKINTCIIPVHGMHCAGCEMTIENHVKLLPGIRSVKADFEGDQVSISYDEELISLEAIVGSIKEVGYEPELASSFAAANPVIMDNVARLRNQKPTRALRKFAAALLAATSIVLIIWLDTWLMNHADMPKLGRDISYGLLFVIGFLTSFHCVGMCGPFILGYTAKTVQSSHMSHLPHILYGTGKTLSYTLIGALFGAFGSIIAFTPYTQGMVGIAAGMFLILYGLHMLEAFTFLRHFQIKMPAFWTRLVGKEYRKHGNPFIIGLLNGLLIICGPLQAMYVMAAGTGNWFDGGAILFFFGLGTLPLLMGFGVLTSLLSANVTPKLLKASGYIVMALGAVMLNRGLAVTGTGIDFNTLSTVIAQRLSPERAVIASNPNLQVIEMDVLRSGYSPNKFILRKGVPVQWVINGKEINECNKAIVVPQYNLSINLKPGIQTVEFTPKETGVIPWSCWMGMIPGSFVVVDNGATAAQIQPTADPAAAPTTDSANTGQPSWQDGLNRWLQDFLSELRKGNRNK